MRIWIWSKKKTTLSPVATGGCTEANFFRLHLNSFGDSRWETFIQKWKWIRILLFSFPSQLIKDNQREWESTNHRGSKTNLGQGSTSHWGIGADHCHHSRCSWPDPSAVSSRHQTDNHQQWQRSKPNRSSRTNLALGSTRQDTGSHQDHTGWSWQEWSTGLSWSQS